MTTGEGWCCTGVFEGIGIVLSLDLVVVMQIFALYFIIIKLNIYMLCAFSA